MTALLQIIAKWQLPPTGQFWDIDKLQPMSYAACYGSNGERDFMRNVAQQALNEWQKEPMKKKSEQIQTGPEGQ